MIIKYRNKMLSSASKYSIVILQFLSVCEPESYYTVAEIAQRTSTPAAYLAKLSKELTWEGILESKRGAKGGVRLSKKGRSLSLYEVCNIMKDPVIKQECVLRQRPCNPENPCAFHSEYSPTRKHLMDFLQSSTIDQVSTSDLF